MEADDDRSSGGLSPTLEDLRSMRKATEITKLNYEKGIDELIALIGVCDFVSIDATIETTGLVQQNEEWSSQLKDLRDPFGDWYDNIKFKEKTSFLLEVGIALFKRVPKKRNQLECEVFNIPVFPACVDDNEWSRFHGNNSCPRIKFDGYAVEFIQAVKFNIDKPLYLAAPFLNKNLAKAADNYIMENPTFMISSRKRPQNIFLMPDLIARVNEDDRKKIVDRLRGVSKIFEAIAQKGIPIVGHHLFLKLLFIYKDFFQYLPDTYMEYWDAVKGLFKIVYDTKYLADEGRSLLKPGSFERSLLNGNTLYDIFRAINKTNQCPIEPNTYHVTYSWRSAPYFSDLEDLMDGIILEEDNESYCYVAGFDALVAGLVFLDIMKTFEVREINCYSDVMPKGGDYLTMFLQGNAQRFNQKLFGECPICEQRGDVYQQETVKKKKMHFDIIQEARKKKIYKHREVRMVSSQDIEFTP